MITEIQVMLVKIYIMNSKRMNNEELEKIKEEQKPTLRPTDVIRI